MSLFCCTRGWVDAGCTLSTSRFLGCVRLENMRSRSGCRTTGYGNVGEPPRVPWRLHQYERGWSPWDDREDIQSSFGRGRCGSFTSGVTPGTGLMAV